MKPVSQREKYAYCYTKCFRKALSSFNFSSTCVTSSSVNKGHRSSSIVAEEVGPDGFLSKAFEICLTSKEMPTIAAVTLRGELKHKFIVKLNNFRFKIEFYSGSISILFLGLLI